MPIILNVIIGVPQMLSNIQMILICVGVSADTLLVSYRCSREYDFSFADGCPSRSEHVLGAARKRLALSPAP
jgi:hypothetical protein